MFFTIILHIVIYLICDYYNYYYKTGIVTIIFPKSHWVFGW